MRNTSTFWLSASVLINTRERVFESLFFFATKEMLLKFYMWKPFCFAIRFIMPNLVNIWSFIGIRCKIQKSMGPLISMPIFTKKRQGATIAPWHTFPYKSGIPCFYEHETDSYNTSSIYSIRHDKLNYGGWVLLISKIRKLVDFARHCKNVHY